MQNEQDYRRYTAAQLRAKAEAGETLTDWDRVRDKTEAELEADIASDPDWADIPADWHKDAVLVIPADGTDATLHLDAAVVHWFKAQGADYQQRINAVLRAHMDSAIKADAA